MLSLPKNPKGDPAFPQKSRVLLSLPEYFSGRTQRGDSDGRSPSRKVSKKSDEESLKIIVGLLFTLGEAFASREKVIKPCTK